MLGMALILTMIFGKAFEGDFSVPIALVNVDQSEAADEFINNIQNNIDGYNFEVLSQNEMEQKVEDTSTLAGVLIQDGYKQDMSKITIVTGKDAVEVMKLKHQLTQIINSAVNKDKLAVAIKDTLDIKEDIKTQVVASYDKEFSDKAYVVKSTATGKSSWADYNNLMHYILGFMLFFTTFSMVFVMADILKEKKLHVFQRNLVTPVSHASQLFAKMIVTFMLGVMQIAIILFAGQYLFGINWGDNLGILLLISSCYILTFTCFGLFLSSVIKSYDQIGALTPIVLVSTAMLGGCMWPLEIINSKWLLLLSNITPQKWALSAMEDIAMRGASPSTATTSILVLLGMAVVYFLLGLRVMKRNLI
jgi:ABC-2 type transport system permease protein